MSSAQTSANCRRYLVEALVGNGFESELSMDQAQVFTYRPAMRKMRLCEVGLYKHCSSFSFAELGRIWGEKNLSTL